MNDETLYTIKAQNRFFWATYLVRAQSPQAALDAIKAELAHAAADDKRNGNSGDTIPLDAFTYTTAEPVPVTRENVGYDAINALGARGFAVLATDAHA